MKRKTMREQLIENQKAETMWARAFGKPVRSDIGVIPAARVKKIKTDAQIAKEDANKVPTEHAEQVAFIRWFRIQYRGVRLFSIPNASLRSVGMAAFLKSEGMSAGAPDLHIPAFDLYIEFKRVKGSVISPAQKEWADYLLQIGKKHFFAYGCNDAINKLKEVLDEQ